LKCVCVDSYTADLFEYWWPDVIEQTQYKTHTLKIMSLYNFMHRFRYVYKGYRNPVGST
jgi:hypothetical protein